MKQLIVLLFVLLLIGCKTDPSAVTGTVDKTGVTAKAKHARFGISWANGLSKVQDTLATDTAEFSLGELGGTKNYYFILSNSGDTAISNVHIYAQDSTMVVTPDSLFRIDPFNAATGIIPIIKLTLLHGVVLEGGSGYKPLQAAGPQEKLLRITGQSDTALTVYVKLRYTVQTFAFDLRKGTRVVDFVKDYMGDNFGFPQYTLGQDTTEETYLRNLGSVPIKVKQGLNAITVDTIFTVAAGDSLLLHVPKKQPMSFLRVYNERNVVADGNKYWQIRADGSIYLGPIWDM